MFLRFRKGLLALGGVGLILCLLAGLSKYVDWFCVGLSDGCRHTAAFGLWGVPLWVWGAGLLCADYLVSALEAAFAVLVGGKRFWY